MTNLVKTQRGALLNTQIMRIQNKKVKKISKIKKLDSFLDFHTKRPKLQNREMHLLALILGFGG
jgi:hypothetical protein